MSASEVEILAAVFKEAWHAADERGEAGIRTHEGIAAVLEHQRRGTFEAQPLFAIPIAPWFRWFAWRPTCTADRGWRWLRPVWKRRFQTSLHLDGPTDRWYVTQVATPPRG